MQQAKPPKDTTGGKDFDEVTKDDAEQGEDDDSEDAMGNGEESEKQEMVRHEHFLSPDAHLVSVVNVWKMLNTAFVEQCSRKLTSIPSPTAGKA